MVFNTSLTVRLYLAKRRVATARAALALCYEADGLTCKPGKGLAGLKALTELTNATTALHALSFGSLHALRAVR